MKISFRDLENARRDPVAFGRSLVRPAQGGGMNRGYFMDWRDAVLKWESQNIGATQVRNELQATLERRFTGKGSALRTTQTLARFDEFVAAETTRRYRFQRSRMDIELHLAELAQSPLRVSGEVPLLHRFGTRYIATLLLSQDVDWEQELRTPLLQMAVADKLNLFYGEVSIAAYLYPQGVFEEVTFDDAELQRSKQEVLEVLTVVEQAMT